MRSRVTLLALMLVFATAMSPAVEVVAGCLEQCADETPGQEQCSRDACCSCCVHAGPMFASLPSPVPSLTATGAAVLPGPTATPPGRGLGILHVPKLSIA
jgi:hypothetical protein